jgi:oxygen-independent coproporphyrinogen-3 oxidase
MHLYFHIPFCKQACHYCDFHFSTNQSRKSELVEAISREIALQKNYLSDSKLQTIYFGGGTPSLLNASELNTIFETITKHFRMDSVQEITLEANPDDIHKESLKVWKEAGINRLSIGIQSFNEEHLQFLNRAHTASEAETCVKLAQDYSFENQTIDLIYGIPSSNHDIWRKDLEKALNLGINHLSAYCLTVEEKTVFGNRLKKKLMKPIDDDFASEQFDILLKTTKNSDFEQYEISNFARNEAYSLHNTSYWKNEPYLGIGPSAHSFNGTSRQWNISSNSGYINAIIKGKVPSESEVLTNSDRANELLMTGLRTKWGINLDLLKQWADITNISFQKELNKLIRQEDIEIRNNHLILTEKGKIKADRIASDLFFE